MKCIIIGIIGEAGSGKTTITKFLESNLNCLHIEVDKIGHNALNNQVIKDNLVAHFGDLLDMQGNIDRKILGSIVFKNNAELLYLNTVTHPYIFNEIKNLIEVKKNSYEYIIIEGAVLIEIGAHQLCHQVVYLYAPKEIREERLVKYRGIPHQKAINIIKAQKKATYYQQFAAKTFDTSKGDDEMFDKITRYFRSLHEN